MTERLGDIGRGTRILDLGAGYGGAACFLAEHYGCDVTCLNLSETQNTLNRKLTAEAGLADCIAVVRGDFESIPEKDDSLDVVWSLDAILHSVNRRRVLDEVRRVLRPGGRFIFTDPMQPDDCPNGVLQPILDNIKLATPRFAVLLSERTFEARIFRSEVRPADGAVANALCPGSKSPRR
jgi:ubiquinone/menaquinone biosynthesis C-methylase UbiE